MFLMSNNLFHYFHNEGRSIPSDAVARINLAWQGSLQDLANNLTFLDAIGPYPVWLDFPIGRLKPPNHQYSIDEIRSICDAFIRSVKYIAVSNVSSAKNLTGYLEAFPDCIVVPKIEDSYAIENLPDIISVLPTDRDRYIMLDREDLFSNLLRDGATNDVICQRFIELIATTHMTAENANVKVLELKGVVFSDA